MGVSLMGRKLIMIPSNSVYNRLRVLGYSKKFKNTNGKILNTVICICDCGKMLLVEHRSVRNGKTRSCGCLREDLNIVHGNTVGGETRLHACWRSMHRRSRERGDSCRITPMWFDFKNFEKWASSAGYSDELVLCRNGDIGDYSPDNVRWDTQGNNMKETRKNYEITTPNGEIHNIVGLELFCNEYGLKRNRLSEVASGKRSHFMGFKVRILT